MEALALVRNTASGDDLGTVADGGLDHLRDLVQAGLVDQRAHVQVIVHRRVAVARGGHGRGDLVDELVSDLALDVDTLGAVAHLPGVDHPRRGDGGHGQL
ncbi:hypothetical protein D3C81_1750580 [compost metagenome]